MVEKQQRQISNTSIGGRRAIIFMAVVCLYGGLLGFSLHGAWNEWNVNEGIKEQEEILEYSQCNDLDLESTSECLRNYVSSFYNYTSRSDEIRSIEDIKENGGDCYDYNKLYEKLGKELGFDTFSFRIKVGEMYHRIAIISDDTGYCLMDQLHDSKCFRSGYEE